MVKLMINEMTLSVLKFTSSGLFGFFDCYGSTQYDSNKIKPVYDTIKFYGLCWDISLQNLIQVNESFLNIVSS